MLVVAFRACGCSHWLSVSGPMGPGPFFALTPLADNSRLSTRLELTRQTAARPGSNQSRLNEGGRPETRTRTTATMTKTGSWHQEDCSFGAACHWACLLLSVSHVTQRVLIVLLVVCLLVRTGFDELDSNWLRWTTEKDSNCETWAGFDLESGNNSSSSCAGVRSVIPVAV